MRSGVNEYFNTTQAACTPRSCKRGLWLSWWLVSERPEFPSRGGRKISERLDAALPLLGTALTQSLTNQNFDR